jgi:uncharacterized DUF497 family protein
MHVGSAVRFRLGDLRFTWDPAKAASNIEKHGITFEEAATTWLDLFAIERFDETHTDEEDRWIRVGASLRGALLVVWSTERPARRRTFVQIIGARRATRREWQLYEQGIDDRES